MRTLVIEKLGRKFDHLLVISVYKNEHIFEIHCAVSVVYYTARKIENSRNESSFV